MRVWLYGRLSDDDDVEMHSLKNQMQIIRDYAQEQGYTVVGESFDDNSSGMRFDRQGVERLTAAVESNLIDAVIVKDMSRLGRHRTQTSLYIDFLRYRGVAVLSATEGFSTMEDKDDLAIGITQLMNDYYAKDIGNKIRHGYREKQKKGIVVTPPFGYWKDKNTNSIRLHPEAALTVRLIYELYCEGLGQKEITRRLNALERKTPRQLRDERCGKADGKCYRWTYQSVKNVLADESYTGLLINHQTETHGRIVTAVPAAEQFRHADFYPAIVDREEWEQAQALLKANAKPYRGNTASHRYAGLLTCGDCGSTFVPRIRCWNGNRRVEYLCRSYMRHGKEVCPSHRIRESELDARVQQYAEELRDQLLAEQAALRQLKCLLERRCPAIHAKLCRLRQEVQTLEEEIDELTILRIQADK